MGFPKKGIHDKWFVNMGRKILQINRFAAQASLYDFRNSSLQTPLT